MGRILLVSVVALCCSCAVPTVYMVSRTAEFTPCDEEEVTIVSPNPDQGGGSFTWVATCRGVRVQCSHAVNGQDVAIACEGEGGAAIPAAPIAGASAQPVEPAAPAPAAPVAPVEPVAPPPPAEPPPPVVNDTPAPEGAVTRGEIMAALAGISEQLQACAPAGSPVPPLVTLSMVIGSDGSATFLGVEPPAPNEVSDCLAVAFGGITLRATTAEPFNFVSDSISLQ